MKYFLFYYKKNKFFKIPFLFQTEHKKDEMNISLFKKLSKNHPQSMVTLEYQYRMNKDIMLLSNTIYNQQLKCGNDNISEVTFFF